MGASTKILIARRAREAAAAGLSAAHVPEAPTHDREMLPEGYAISGGEGGYWILTGPDGEVIPGPSNGKWQGRDGAADSAWRHVAGG